jgi:hypothetical protein
LPDETQKLDEPKTPSDVEPVGSVMWNAESPVPRVAQIAVSSVKVP